MLRNGTGFSKTYIAVGFTDMRLGIDSLALLIQEKFHLNPLEKGSLFLFCGRRSDRIKCLLLFRCRNYKSYSDVLVIPTESRKTYMNHVMISILSE